MSGKFGHANGRGNHGSHGPGSAGSGADGDPLSPWIPWAVAALAAGAALTQSLRLIWLRGRPARELAARRRRGARGERDARSLLRRAGYRIVAEQPEGAIELLLDGERTPLPLRADFLVQRGGARFVADAKTGKSADVRHAATRRQLLEYALAYDCEGALLVDPEGARVVELRLLRQPARRGRLPGLLWFLLGVGTTLVAFMAK